MAFISLQQLYDSWKRVSDWVSGAGSDRPKVQNVNSAGTEIFTAVTPGVMKVSDGTDQLVVNADGSINTVLTVSNALKGAVQTVTTAGTRVQLPNYPCREVTIIAKRANTGSIFVGGSDVSSSVYGSDLQTKDSITLAVSNTNLIYIDASVSGEGVSYVAI